MATAASPRISTFQNFSVSPMTPRIGAEIEGPVAWWRSRQRVKHLGRSGQLSTQQYTNAPQLTV